MDGSSPYSEDLERHVIVGEKIIFVGACNIGAAYTGTYRLDKALDDRFARRLEVSYLPEAKEIELLAAATGIGLEAAKRLVQIAAQVRSEYNKGTRKFSQDISTRVLLGAARDFAALESVRAGAGPKSLQFTVVNRFDSGGESNSERNALSMLVAENCKLFCQRSANPASRSRRSVSSVVFIIYRRRPITPSGGSCKCRLESGLMTIAKSDCPPITNQAN